MKGQWWIVMFLAWCVIEGIYRGLQDRFGPNILEGYRQYRHGHEPDFLILLDDERSRTPARLSPPTSGFLAAPPARLPPPDVPPRF